MIEKRVERISKRVVKTNDRIVAIAKNMRLINDQLRNVTKMVDDIEVVGNDK